jgi:hypothetical protein
LFKIRLPYRNVVKGYVILAILDEFRDSIFVTGWENPSANVMVYLVLIPLYLVAVVYAYRSEYIWQSEK